MWLRLKHMMKCMVYGKAPLCLACLKLSSVRDEVVKTW